MTEPRQAKGPKRHLDPRGRQLAQSLSNFAACVRPLPGLRDPAAVDCLVKQLLDSIRRVAFVKRIAATQHHPDVANPASDLFDPLKAAVVRARQGNVNEAIWLTFLAVHFGKHKRDGWTLARLVYGRSGESGLWDWHSISTNVTDFRRWLDDQNTTLRRYRFSSHRQYESLSAHSATGTGAIVDSFIHWVASAGSFDALVRAAHRRVGQNPIEVFDALYKQMDGVPRFGRLGKFDFLTMLSKLGLAPIEPGSTYIWDNATGPYRGIRLLVTGATEGPLNRKQADEIYDELASALGVGMQELEDALCNWQKDPTEYQYFRG